MIEIIDKKKCSGCSACAGVCPVNCISMTADEEGFVYPKVDIEKCVDCHVCEKICPIINPKAEIPFEQRGFIVQSKDEKILRESTAGGVYTALAKYVLRQNGIVFGVELSEELVVHHICVETEKDLWKFRNSKYVQSYVGGDIIRAAKKYVVEGRLVLFSGTPCQVEGLKSLLGREYDNLITVDVVCRAVPSPLLFRKYIEYEQEKQKSKIERVIFRDKYYGYKYSTLNLISERNKGKYHLGVESDPWLRAFFSNKINRPSCYHCAFRKRYRVSDFTIWDCFQVGRYSKELDNDKGATRMLIHTRRGQHIFDCVKTDYNYIEVDVESMIQTTHEMFYSVEEPVKERREEMFSDAREMNGKKFFDKYFPDSVMFRLKHAVRMFFVYTGLYDIVKKVYVKMTHKY